MDRRHLAAMLLAATFVSAPRAATTDARVALTEYRCYICHADHEAKAGPAYVDVAWRYRDDPNAVTRLAREIRRGIRGGGPWHMPPHPEVSQAEARAIARYIMSLAPPRRQR